MPALGGTIKIFKNFKNAPLEKLHLPLCTKYHDSGCFVGKEPLLVMQISLFGLFWAFFGTFTHIAGEKINIFKKHNTIL